MDNGMNYKDIGYDAKSFLTRMNYIQNNTKVFENEEQMKETCKMLDIAAELENKVREYKIKHFKKKVTETDLRNAFLNHERFRILNDRRPGLFVAALQETLHKGKVGEMIKNVSSANGDPKKVSENLKKEVGKIIDEFEDGIKDFKQKYENEPENKQTFLKNDENTEKEENDDSSSPEENKYQQKLKEEQEKQMANVENLIQQFKSKNISQNKK